MYEPAVRRHVAQPNLLRFVEWGGDLVFDCENPEVYAAYCGRVNALQARVVVITLPPLYCAMGEPLQHRLCVLDRRYAGTARP